MRLITLLFLLTTAIGFAQQTDLIDVQCYRVELTVNDESDSIKVIEAVEVLFLEDCPSFYLDLKSIGANGKGMLIDYKRGVKENGKSVQYQQTGDKLFIETTNAKKGNTNTYVFSFTGIPDNGLIIGENKFGNRTFFGDNWPNRAHNWFACVDHPSDKATISFTVNAPAHYECVATGVLKSSTLVDTATRVFRYESIIPLPTKVMVVGIADFVVVNHPAYLAAPITLWVYPEDSAAGFYDMRLAPNITAFFHTRIGQYPFEKLANVQSTTMFGGMENAGNIFYDENAINGRGTMEALMAHEIAHQWFGNSASEQDWQHLWLSEGFATYFTNLYFEHEHGQEAFHSRLITERKKVIDFAKSYDHPVIDTTYSDLMDLLNANSYQKGSWFLHMLRTKIGDDVFWEGIRAYYAAYAFDNATSDDFRKVMEATAGVQLGDFFNQWLRQAGHPILHVTPGKKKIRIQQVQNGDFSFPLEIEYQFKDGSTESATYEISEKQLVLKPDSKKKIKRVVLDPDVKLLFEER